MSPAICISVVWVMRAFSARSQQKGFRLIDIYSWRALVLQFVGFVIERHLEKSELGFGLREGGDDPIHHRSTFNLPPRG